MSTELSAERRAEIEAHRDALAARLAESAYAGLEDTWDIMHDFDDLLAALCQKTRECNALAFTARRLAGERDALAGFARKVIESSCPFGCDVSGGDVQEWAVEAGILRPVVVMRACREDSDGCACAEFGFPTTCYRFTARTAAAQEEG